MIFGSYKRFIHENNIMYKKHVKTYMNSFSCKHFMHDSLVMYRICTKIYMKHFI